MSTPLLIGWKERADFPDWGCPGVRVKIDTGAKTSAMDATIEEIHTTDNGAKILKMRVALYRHKPERVRLIECEVVKTLLVRNTSGVIKERFVIETTIGIGPVQKRIQLSVADRGRMLSPIIIGRRALAGDFLVDVSRPYLLRARKGE